MFSEKISSESNGEVSQRPSILKRESLLPWWAIITVVLINVLMLFYHWSLLFNSTRPTSLVDTQGAIATAVVAFLVAALATYVTASVARMRYSNIYAVSAVAVYAFLLITVLFATLYWTIGTTAHFNIELSRIDAIYFALGTLTTAGTGSIAPTSHLARAFVSGQMILNLVFIAGALTIVIARWSEIELMVSRRAGNSRRGRSHRSDQRGMTSSEREAARLGTAPRRHGRSLHGTGPELLN